MDHKLQTYFFLGLFLLVSVLAFFLLRPYFGILLLAGTAAFLFRPTYRRIQKVMWDSEGIAAFVTTLIILILVLVPLTVAGTLIFREALHLYTSLTADGIGISARISDFIAAKAPALSRFVPSKFDVDQYAKQIIGALLQDLGSVFTSVTRLIFASLLSLLALFYFLKDGHRLKRFLVIFSPLPDVYDNQIFSKLSAAANSVIKGSLVVGVVQGTLTGFGFWLFGVPNPALWGMIAAIASLIPTIGTGLVVTPGVIYLFAMGATTHAIGLIVWGVFAVGLIDNFLGPKLIGHGVKIHPFLILLSVLGGISLFGPIGFLAGPLILSWLFALLDMYPSLIKPDTHKHS